MDPSILSIKYMILLLALKDSKGKILLPNFWVLLSLMCLTDEGWDDFLEFSETQAKGAAGTFRGL